MSDNSIEYTRAGANVPGQTPLSRPVPGQNHLPKRTQKQEKDVPKQEKTFQNMKKMLQNRKKTFQNRKKLF